MSVEGTLSTAAATLIDALSLPTVSVVERDVPTVMEGETLPLVVVSVTEDRFEPATAHVSLAYFGYYTLSAVIVRRANDVDQ